MLSLTAPGTLSCERDAVVATPSATAAQSLERGEKKTLMTHCTHRPNPSGLRFESQLLPPQSSTLPPLRSRTYRLTDSPDEAMHTRHPYWTRACQIIRHLKPVISPRAFSTLILRF